MLSDGQCRYKFKSEHIVQIILMLTNKANPVCHPGPLLKLSLSSANNMVVMRRSIHLFWILHFVQNDRLGITIYLCNL